jgi:hypothetical protein
MHTRNTLALAAGLLVLSVSALVYLPWISVRHYSGLTSVETATVVNNVRDCVLKVIGGCGVAFGSYVAFQNLGLAREGKLTDRFSTAVDQLGSDKLAVRIGAIFALERITIESARDRRAIAEVLGAFIRSPPNADAHRERNSVETPYSNYLSTMATYKLRADLQAALTVLGRAVWRGKEHTVDLSHSVIDGADLKGTDLRSFQLFHTSLAGSLLADADLRNTLTSGADFSSCVFHGTKLAGAVFLSCRFEYSSLGGALDLELAKFSGCDMRGAKYAGRTVVTDSDDRGSVVAPD